MKFITLLILLVFIGFRNSFTVFKGKRPRTKVTSFIYWGRKSIEIVISFLVPAFILFGFIETKTTAALYSIGLIASLFGLMLMVWTRLCRDKDWGFMGDDSGERLFVDGPYQLSRHPYYAGAIFVGIGLYLQLNYLLALLMLPVVLFILHVTKKEEDFLQNKFGEEYKEYKRRVGFLPWWKGSFSGKK